MIEKKAYSWFLCVLLISVLLFPLRTTAGRVILLQTEEDGSGNHGNYGNKIPVHGSHSNPAHSRTDHSSPSRATPSRIRNSSPSSATQSNDPNISGNTVSKSDSAVTAACGARQPYTQCRPSSTRSGSCSGVYHRDCIKT